MIQVFGDESQPEYEAAVTLTRMIRQEWGELGEAHQKVAVIASAQCHGQKVRDIDLLLLVQLLDALPVRLPRAGALGLPGEVYVKSLCVTLEVKGHPPEYVGYTDNGDVRVRYPDHWHNASTQSRDQVFSLKNYLRALGHEPPFIAGVVWLRGVLHQSLPRGLHNIVGSNAAWPDMVAAIMAQQHPLHRDGFELLDSAREPGRITRIRHVFTHLIQPSRLDRRKLEAITGAEVVATLDDEKPGESQLILRGRGGTGKTVCLLALAFSRYEKLRQRTLLLTYNVALAAEIERLLSIRGIRDRAGQRAIRVETILTFFSRVLRVAGLLADGEGILPRLGELKQQLLEYLRDDEMRDAVRQESDLLIWDLVCIDEAQDCPEDERDLLHLLFGPGRCVVADGIDQMVRLSEACEWQAPGLRVPTRTRFLGRSLRMQHNLCQFANAVARELGLEVWRVEPNPELSGGRVMIITGEQPPGDELLDHLSRINREAGNEPIDMLACVPPSLVNQAEPAGCLPARQLAGRGLAVWDGTVPEVRQIPPLANNMHRFVQYESCRGLEGWVTILYALDRFHDGKFSQALQLGGSLTEEDRFRRASTLAAEWMMIPLTRCINTLAIHISRDNSLVGEAILRVAARHPDFVEVTRG